MGARAFRRSWDADKQSWGEELHGVTRLVNGV